MAKIRNSNPKQSGGGYERLVGDADMASIFTKAQSIARLIKKYLTFLKSSSQIQDFQKLLQSRKH